MMDPCIVIECVKKYPSLYDPKTGRTSERRQAWEQVGKDLNQDVEPVKRKWKNIKDEYVKFIKGNSKSRNYALESEMAFLKPYFQAPSSKRKKKNNIKHEETDPESNDDENDPLTLSSASPKSFTDDINGLDLILLGVSNLMKSYPQVSQEPAEALSPLDEVHQTCLQINNLIKTYAQSEPLLVKRKINHFLKAHCVNNNNDHQTTITGRNKLKIKINFKR